MPVDMPRPQGPSVTLSMPGRYAYLGAIRQAVLHTCSQAGLSDEKSAQLEMAVDEACSNIIEHGYGGEHGPVGQHDDIGLRIQLIRAPGRVVVEIYDRGEGFNFEGTTGVAPADYVDERRQRGLGLYIIRCFVDEVAYQRGTAMGNCLRLTKLV